VAARAADGTTDTGRGSDVVSYLILRKTEVEIEVDGTPVRRFVGVGSYTYMNEDTVECFGLACIGEDPKYLTHMRYGLDYFRIDVALQHSRNISGDWFEFCGGNGCCTIRIHADELERACRELGLLT
jgi:hypothetical protein